VRSAIQFGCVAACVVPSGEGSVGGVGGGGDEAGGGAEVAAVVVAGFAFVRAAGGFMAASSAMTGSGVMTVVGALPASPVCMELDSFSAMLHFSSRKRTRYQTQFHFDRGSARKANPSAPISVI
jgi:hypothetical protein